MTGLKGKLGLGLRIVVGLLFLAAAIAKLVGAQKMVEEFGQVGFGQWLRYATGLAEFVGVALLVRARTVPVGAAILIGVCAGALYAQLAVLHQDFVHVIVLGAILAWLAWSYWKSGQSSQLA